MRFAQSSTSKDSTNLLNRTGPPDTPDDFLNIVIEFDKRRRSQRLATQKPQKACTKSCEGVIAATGTRGQPGHREQTPLRYRVHHALRLADEIQRRVRQGLDGLSRTQRAALMAWVIIRLDNSVEPLVERLGREDAKIVTEAEVKKLIDIFSAILFRTQPSDAEMRIDFKWQDWRNTPQNLGITRPIRKGEFLIEMCAFNCTGENSYGSLNERTLSRLATIIHELVHVYLIYYACRCVNVLDSFEENVSQSDGHGRAWQRIAGSIERAAPVLLGFPLDLGGLESIAVAWKTLKHWPSQVEVEGWRS
jgi:hypothetical protein